MWGKLLFGALDAVLAMAEAGSKTYDRAKKLARLLKKTPAPDETPVPLTQRSVEWQERQIHDATMRRDELRPPARNPSPQSRSRD